MWKRRLLWALWLLLTAALLVVPFLSFLLLSRARRRTEEKRAAFEADDNAAAIRAMFTHTVDWLRAGGLQTENRLFSQCAEAVEAIADADYAARFAGAVAIWQEAAYSGHALTDAQRQAVRELLARTSSMLYEKANKRTRFRMNYVACLVRESCHEKADEDSIDGGVAYRIRENGKSVGGVVLKIDEETQHNHLDLLFVTPEAHSKGIGFSAWQAVERLYPETRVWETCTPYFETRNIHFYGNKCGFHIVEFFNARHPDPHDPETGEENDYGDAGDGDGMFRFEKRMTAGDA